MARFCRVALLVIAGCALAHASDAATVTGELKTWHKITITFDGPDTSEGATPTPFLEYRLNVTFVNGSTTYVVPGYYCADGDAANSHATSGNKWRVHFAPGLTGTWNYTVSMRSGTNVAVDASPTAGAAWAPLDGATGSFTVTATDKTGRDHRGKGRLEYVNKHHLRFAETSEYFMKCGADAPENFLAYQGFDGSFKSDGIEDARIKTWTDHVGDHGGGDPTWDEEGVGGATGQGIIGAINYLASEGLNAFSFLTFNIGGDDKNCFLYVDYNDYTRIDCSRMDQWEIVFEHGDQIGMFMHFKTQETENELFLDGGDLGTERKLYYRELVARFAHHLALNWNLGEEINNATTDQKKSWAQYFFDTDPYHHHIVIHNGANHYDLMGPGSKLTGFSLQTNNADFSNVHSQTLNYIDLADAAGKPWAVACDEPGDASHALRPDDDAGTSHEDGRKNGLWGNMMAGGWGTEWYFGYNHAESDLTCEDWRSRDTFWDYGRYALEFFQNNAVPFWNMTNDDAATSADYMLVAPGETDILVYTKDASTTETVDLGVAAEYTVKWYDPRNGGALQDGSLTTVTGAGTVSIGDPPGGAAADDWVVWLELSGSVTTYTLTVENGSGDGEYPQGSSVPIVADPPPTDKIFDQWIGDTAGMANVNAASTTITMPAADATVTATYVDAPPGDTVISFTLVNADTDVDIGPLNDGDTVNVAAIGTSNLNIRANTSPATVGSVRFGLDGNANYRTENSAPYAMEGDTTGDYNAWVPSLASHTVTATPYSASGAGGTAGTPLTVTFTVVDDAATYTLTVISGTGSGSYAAGAVVTIEADPPGANQVFAAWTGDVAGVADVAAASTTISMPAAVTAITATYVSTYTLTVSSGTGDGEYAAGAVVPIVADAPGVGQVFDAWTGDVTNVDDVNAASTTITMPAADATVTAMYVAASTYALTVNSGTGDGEYAAGAVVSIAADAAPAGQVFDAWTGDVTNVDDVNAASTTITMPAADATVTAMYVDAPPGDDDGGGCSTSCTADCRPDVRGLEWLVLILLASAARHAWRVRAVRG